MKKLLLILPCLLVGIFAAAFSREEPYFSNLGLDEGLSQMSVLAICQDSDGFIWFGTRNGLNRYDGRKMVVFKHEVDRPGSLVDSHILSLAEDRDHRLWIGSMHGLNRLDLTTGEMKIWPRRKFPIFENGATALCCDPQGRIWVGTAQGLFEYREDEDNFRPETLQGILEGSTVAAIRQTRSHGLVVCTLDRGFVEVQEDLSGAVRHDVGQADHPLPSRMVNSVYEDSHGTLWVALREGGLLHLFPDGTRSEYSVRNGCLKTNTVRCMTETDGILYVGTDSGLYACDLETGAIEATSGSQHHRGELSHFSITSCLTDQSGSLWVGTYSGGVDFYSKYARRFSFYDPTQQLEEFQGIIGPIADSGTRDGGETVYVATEGSGLLRYDLGGGGTETFLYAADAAPSHNIIKSILREGDTVWCGTTQGAIWQFDIPTRRFSLYCMLPKSHSVSIYALLRGRNGELWAATSKPGYGLVRIDKDRQVQDRFAIDGAEEEQTFPSLRCLLAVDRDILLIGSRHDGLFRFDTRTRQLTRFHENGDGPLRLPSNYVTALVRDGKGHIWVGTYGGGISLFDTQEGILKNITAREGLADADVCTIVTDQDDNLWIDAGNYISRYDPVDERIQNFQVGVIGTQEFTPHCGTLLPDGRICFSARNGFILFDPQSLQLNPYIPPVRLTGLAIANKTVTPGKGSPLSRTITHSRQITLPWNRNTLTLSYSALNYVYPSLNQYAYRLLGQDRDWNYVGDRQEAYFTDLRPGKYVFEVKASNNDGLWNETPMQLGITIRPPFWAAWYAWILYSLAALGVFLLINHYTDKRRILEQALLFKQKEQQQQEAFHQARMRMYTSFSHELRTPLTLIISPLEELLDTGGFPRDVKNKLELIYDNSQRLLLLVNQLMDLRKSQAGKMKLKVREDDINLFVSEIYRTFRHIAADKQIELDFPQEDGHIQAWYDRFLFEKVVFNLLSNAIKHAPVHGHVTLGLDLTGKDALKAGHQAAPESVPDTARLLHLTVADDGPGIVPEEMEKIFEPFYQGEDDPANRQSGTGIGLSLSQSVVTLHHGTIWAENRPQGGALFHVVMPVDRDTFGPEDFDQDQEKSLALEVIPSEIAPETLPDADKATVLLIEDTEPVRIYIRERLEKFFRVFETDNGDTALRLVAEKMPDIVVSDIMIPGTSGLEVCARIKEDMLTGHIPVILMTAKSMAVHIIEGYASGADDYIVKPFNINVLISRIKNLLASREQLRTLYGKKRTQDLLGVDLSAGEDRFTQKLFTLIEANIANPELNIDMICREIGLSRTNLYRKLKPITDLSPVELIRNYRLEMATDLLLHSNYNISEIATYTGFNSHAYFTSCFRAAYGCTPSEYAARQHPEANDNGR
ncbi:MAG: response regulator [Bacteroidales bacterium]|nr:response regulator [Bacteroidales bacterium]